MTPAISVIVPAYNEGERIGNCITRWFDYFSARRGTTGELIVVCNGCTDDTSAKADFWAADPPSNLQYRQIDLPYAGKGAAVRTGMLAATGSFRYMADVDLATPPEALDAFLQYQQHMNASVVAGSRYRRGAQVQMTFTRRLTALLFKMLIRPLLPGCSDSQCGFKLFTSRAAYTLFNQLKTPGYAFDVEILALARFDGFYTVEYPVCWEAGEHSTVRLWRDGFRMWVDVTRIKNHFLRRSAPVPKPVPAR